MDDQCNNRIRAYARTHVLACTFAYTLYVLYTAIQCDTIDRNIRNSTDRNNVTIEKMQFILQFNSNYSIIDKYITLSREIRLIYNKNI